MGIEGSSSDAEMVGTTRSRVSFFMNRFRNFGFIYYTGLYRPRAARACTSSCLSFFR